MSSWLQLQLICVRLSMFNEIRYYVLFIQSIFLSRDARIQLMKLHSGDTALNISVKDWEELANFTAGYSGSDLAALTLGALFEPIRDLQQASHWVKLAGIVCCLTVQ